MVSQRVNHIRIKYSMETQMVRLKKKRINRCAFTLVELMIAAICLMLILGPVFMMLRSGTNTSLKGMLRIETTLKARNILQQIYADLKMACFKVPDAGIYSFSNILTKSGDAPNYIYQFYSFPIHQSYSDIFENPTDENAENNRIPSKITYKIEGESAPYTLIREETFNSKTTSKVLSNNINFFEIKDIGITTEVDSSKMQFYYQITLQLVDVLHPKDYDNKQIGEKLRQNQKDVILADFYDIVYPEFFNAIWNDKRLNQNWHTELKINSDEEY